MNQRMVHDVSAMPNQIPVTACLIYYNGWLLQRFRNAKRKEAKSKQSNSVA
jgi:hypothetical protein